MTERREPEAIEEDDDLAALAREFAAKLPERARAIEAEYAAGQLSAVARLAHKLVGAASCYRFDDLARAARRVEDLAKAGSDARDLAAAIDDLSRMCRAQ